MLARLTSSSMAVDSRRSKILRTPWDVLNFLLRTYTTDEIIAEECNEIVNFRQGLAVTEAIYYRMLRHKAVHGETVFSTRRLKSLFFDELPTGTPA